MFLNLVALLLQAKPKLDQELLLKERINIEALNRIHFHKEKGDKVVLCSASLDMLIMPLANYLEVDLISTKLKRNNINGLQLFLVKI